MKILLLVPSLNFGGVEIGTVDLSKTLTMQGEEVIVVSSGGVLVSELEKHAIKHIVLPLHKKSLFTFRYVNTLSGIIAKEAIDIVHAQSRMPAWIAYYACKKTGVPLITSCHGYYSVNFYSAIMARGKKVIAISELISKHMYEQFGVPKEKIHLVYRGVNLAHYHYQPKKEKVPPDTIRIVNIGRLTPLKGHDSFIRAIQHVRKQIPTVEALLVGAADKKNSGYEQELRQLVKTLQLEDTVKFLGSRSDIPVILNDADLLVLSTRTPEAFGRVVIEAGAVGVPVCASRIGGITEIIDDGKDGLLFEAGDEKAMAQAMVKMITDREFSRACVSHLRAKVEKQFSLEKMTVGTHRVYSEVLREKKILVIKLGGLGDVVAAIPSLHMLRQRFPAASISILAQKSCASLLTACPFVNEVIAFDHSQHTMFGLMHMLRQKKFDVSVDLKNNPFTHCLAFLSGIPYRYGFAKGASSALLNRRAPLFKEPERPVQQQFRLLQKVGVQRPDETLELWPAKEDKEYIDQALQKKGVASHDRIIGLAISASKKWPTKNWPVENFSQLASRLVEGGFTVVLIGEKDAYEKMAAFTAHKKIINFVGDTTLGQAVALIKLCEVLVTGDSAPMHIGAALGNRVVALFGPTDSVRHAPPAKDIVLLEKDVECQPCYLQACINREKLLCLTTITVDEVFSAVIQ